MCAVAPASADWSGTTLQAQSERSSGEQAINAGAAVESVAIGDAVQQEVPGSFGGEQQVDEQDLEGNRGRENTTLNQINKMTLEAVLSNNVTDNVVTGNNVITDGAFTNTTGFPMVIQNTGNNVIIQNATILNLNVK
jgi:hypothetical protein